MRRVHLLLLLILCIDTTLSVRKQRIKFLPSVVVVAVVVVAVVVVVVAVVTVVVVAVAVVVVVVVVVVFRTVNKKIT